MPCEWYQARTLITMAEGIHLGVKLTLFCALCSSAVFEAGGHAALIKQLRGGSPAMVANSIAALCNLAGQEVIRRSILSHGAIQALVASLNSTSTQVLVYTVQCLTVLVCDTESGVEVSVSVCILPSFPLLHFCTFNKTRKALLIYGLGLFPSYGLLEAFNHLLTYSD